MKLMLLLSALAAPTTALDRCQTPHCMCELRTLPAYGNQVKEVFFEEDSYRLSSKDIQSLSTWKGPAVVIATTDGCGSPSYNKDLAARRARSVLQVVPGSSWPLGETTSRHNAGHRRTLVVDPSSRLLKLLAANPADYYVLDGSGSMSSHWNQVKQFPFPKGATVWAAKTNKCRPGTPVQNFVPAGPTEIWYPLWRAVKLAKPGTTIMLVSDLRSSIPLSPSADKMITDKAKSKQITIKYITY